MFQFRASMSKQLKCNVFKKNDGYYEYSERYGRYLRLYNFDEWFTTFPNIDFSLVIFNELNHIGFCWDETQEVERWIHMKLSGINLFGKKTK